MEKLTFTEVPNTDGHIKDLGYRLIETSDFDIDVRERVGVNMMDNWIDGLADGFGPVYRGSDGNNYLVHFCYWYDPPAPACWWQVEKV